MRHKAVIEKASFEIDSAILQWMNKHPRQKIHNYGTLLALEASPHIKNIIIIIFPKPSYGVLFEILFVLWCDKKQWQKRSFDSAILTDKQPLHRHQKIHGYEYDALHIFQVPMPSGSQPTYVARAGIIRGPVWHEGFDTGKIPWMGGRLMLLPSNICLVW